MSASEKRSLSYEQALEHIKADLLRGKLRPGDRLPTVAALAAQLGLSQAAVREAYRVLETMGILSVTQGRGTFVADDLATRGGAIAQFEFVERQSIRDLLEARKLLEPEAAALAAERATPAESRAIMAAAAEMERLAHEGEDFIEPDVRFHELIFLAAHNTVLAAIMSALEPMFLDSRRLTTRLPGATEKAVHFHRLIAIAIQEGNPLAARALMSQHVEDVERSLRGREPSADE